MNQKSQASLQKNQKSQPSKQKLHKELIEAVGKRDEKRIANQVLDDIIHHSINRNKRSQISNQNHNVISNKRMANQVLDDIIEHAVDRNKRSQFSNQTHEVIGVSPIKQERPRGFHKRRGKVIFDDLNSGTSETYRAPPNYRRTSAQMLNDSGRKSKSRPERIDF